MSELLKKLLSKRMREQGLLCRVSTGICEGTFKLSDKLKISITYEAGEHVSIVFSCGILIKRDIVPVKSLLSFRLQDIIKQVTIPVSPLLSRSEKELLLAFHQVYATGYTYENFRQHKVAGLLYQFVYVENQAPFTLSYMYTMPDFLNLHLIGFSLRVAASEYAGIDALMKEVSNILTDVTGSRKGSISTQLSLITQQLRKNKITNLIK